MLCVLYYGRVLGCGVSLCLTFLFVTCFVFLRLCLFLCCVELCFFCVFGVGLLCFFECRGGDGGAGACDMRSRVRREDEGAVGGGGGADIGAPRGCGEPRPRAAHVGAVVAVTDVVRSALTSLTPPWMA